VWLTVLDESAPVFERRVRKCTLPEIPHFGLVSFTGIKKSRKYFGHPSSSFKARPGMMPE
jgi:hypothetical protein